MIREGVMISGRYEIVTRIGTGGMADVYKAIDRKLNRYVAMKVLKREFREDQTFVHKFQSEAQSVAGLLHQSIVNVYDVGEDRGLYYIVMEFVDGITLKDYIQKKGNLSAKEVVNIAVQVCAGIEEAHNHNIVHRDIKPQNIMISKEGKVKVTDFGIAKATSSNTISTNAMGSVHYTSPEQARGGFSDVKSDIYSLGITMYEMITGELPFDGESTVSVALRHLQEEITPPSELVDDIPYSLERIILKCTQKSPDRRYANIAQLARDLKRSLAEPDGDFVVISPFVSAAETRMVSAEELETIKNAVGNKGRRQSELEDEFDYDDDYDYDDDDEYEERRARRRKAAKKQIDPQMAKIMRILTVVVTVIFIFILVFVTGKALGIFGDFGPGIKESEEQKLIPDVVGKTEKEARDMCEEVGIILEIKKTEKSTEYDEGIITYQYTQAGVKIENEGMTLRVHISSGKTKGEIKVPDTEDLSLEKAKKLLEQSGFEKFEILPKSHDEIEVDKVIGTEPAAGTKASAEQTIYIMVSEGPQKVLMPRLEGKTKEEALNLIEERGLEVEIEEVFDDAPKDEVISQSVEANKEISKGTEIKIVVSKGKAKVTIPTGLVGKSSNSAIATLKNLELEVVEKYEESTKYNNGFVTYVEGEGVEVEVGSSVIVVISTGPGPSSTQDPGTTQNPGTTTPNPEGSTDPNAGTGTTTP